MSLINDYLKKSRAAKEDKSSTPAGVPPVMKPSPGAGKSASQEKKASPKTVVLLVVVILLGIAGYYMTMPPPAPAPQAYPQAAGPSEESRVSGLPETENIPGESNLQPATALKNALRKRDRAAGEPGKRKLDQRESRSLPEPPVFPEKGRAETAEKRSLKDLPNSATDSCDPVTAAAPQSAAAELDESENLSSDPAAVKITVVPGTQRNRGKGFKESAGVRRRRPHRKDDLDHLFQVGVLALNSGNRSRALYYFNQVLDLDPKHQDTILNLAVISLEHNDFEKSRELLAQAALNDPHDARVKVNQGLLALKNENFANARKLFADALLIDPGSTSALNNLAWLAQSQGDKAEALFYFRNLVAIDPQNLTAWLAYASCCEREKDFSQALRSYQEALQSRLLENDPALERRIRERIKLLSEYVD
ncbi:MAG: tetratricopeptide repeat protein [Pseudomonadota bacterium]|nr:tetratricopeptide repeat protein [Pseudomonadota bacterium]